LLVTVCTGFLLFSQNANADEPESLSVMSWNLEWFFDNQDADNFSELAKEKCAPSRADWDWRRDAVARAVATSKPTIVALQEIENQRVLYYLSRALDRNHSLQYDDLFIQGRDFFTEQDVGMLFREPADAVLISQMRRTREQSGGSTYFDVSKHILAVFEFPVGETTERVTVMNVHLRARLEGLPMRIRQARLIHQWIGQAIENGENIILLGDMNTEERGDRTLPESDLGILAGMETDRPDDDLVDLCLHIAGADRQTHLLPGRQFDRILVSQSLIDDTPGKKDLVFESIQVAKYLCVQGAQDEPEVHWEQYWQIPEDERDLSDHYPLIATFGVK
tara:strand:+ start:317625 stop:318629 length:1005 start_codon:yes stop_codon:yes gene_type:complete